MVWPFKKRTEAARCMSVGEYEIDKDIKGLRELSLLSNQEALALGLEFEFEAEAMWRAPDVEFMNQQWEVILGTVARSIYKISLQWTGPSEIGKQISKDVNRLLSGLHGQASSQSYLGLKMDFWKAANGNLILHNGNMGVETILTVTITSDMVAQFARITGNIAKQPK